MKVVITSPGIEARVVSFLTFIAVPDQEKNSAEKIKTNDFRFFLLLLANKLA